MNTIFKYVQDLAVNQNFKERVYKAQQRKLMENIDNSLIGEIKEIYRDYVSDLSTTKAEGLITISFTISGAGTSFEEVEGDMNNIADAYGMIVSDFSSFCDEGQDIDCDEYLRTGQPVEFCVSFEHLEKPLHENEKLYGTYGWTAEKCADWVKSHMYRVYQHARGLKSAFNTLKQAVANNYEKFGDDTLISCSDDELMDIATIIYNRQRSLPPSYSRKL